MNDINSILIPHEYKNYELIMPDINRQRNSDSGSHDNVICYAGEFDLKLSQTDIITC